MAKKLNITFVDELGNNLNRYKAIDVNTGDEYLFDLSRNGTITTHGTPLNAENMNLIVKAINDIELSYIKSITQDESGKIIITKQDDTILDLNIANVVEESVQCPHRYEITGNTGDEHGLAISDQQMLLDRVQGRTLVKNQLIDKVNIPQTQTLNGITFTNNGDGSFTINGTATSSFSLTIKNFSTSLNRHKIIIYGCPNGGGADKYRLYIEYRATSIDYVNDFGNGAIKTIPSDTTTCYYQFRIIEGVTVSNLKFTPQLIDLTAKYGAGKEPTTLEQVLNDIQDYEEYDEGSFVHSKNNLVSTGRNVWDEEWETGYYDVDTGKPIVSTAHIRSKNFIKVLPSTNYFGKVGSGTNIWILQYGINKEYLKSTHYVQNTTFKTGSNTYYIKFYAMEYGIIYKNDICINISDESFNGTYEPYQEDVMVIDRELKAFEYIDNITNEKVNKGALADLGTLDWQYQETYPRFMAEVENIKNVGSYEFADFLCEKYIASTSHENKTAFHYSTRIYIYDTDYTDVATFKAAMSGVMLYYETTTETKEPLQLPRGMAVWGNGMQIQKGTIPYLLTKTYSLSIGAQVKANIQIDKEQQDQINTLNEKHNELREDFDNTFSSQNVKRETSALIDYPSKELSYPNQQVTVDEIRGRSLNVNQLFNLNKITQPNGLTVTNNGDGSITINGTTTDTRSYVYFNEFRNGLLPNHKYAFLGDNSKLAQLDNGRNVLRYTDAYSGYFTLTGDGIFTISGTGIIIFAIIINSGNITFNNFTIYPQLIDLTAMYGVGNEPTDVNKILIDIEKFTTNGVLPYNVGTIKNLNVTEIKSVGANIFGGNKTENKQYVGNYYCNNDGSLAINSSNNCFVINVKPNETYHIMRSDKGTISVSGGILHFLDNNDNLISYSTSPYGKTEDIFQVPSNCYKIRISLEKTVTYELMINVSNNDINGKYFPYEEDTYEIPQVDLKSAGTAYDSLYPSKGKFVNRVGVVEDLSMLGWLYNSDVQAFFTSIANGKYGSDNAFMTKYSKVDVSGVYTIDKSFSFGSNFVGGGVCSFVIRDEDYTDVASFKQSLKGVKLYYELVTPVESDIVCPNNYKVWQFGTEMQLGNFPTTITKDYSISILDQITKNVEVDKNQSDNIEELNGKSNELDIQLKDAINRIVELEGNNFDINKLKLDNGVASIYLKYNDSVISSINNVAFEYIPIITIEHQTEGNNYAERLLISNNSSYQIVVKSTNGLKCGDYENIIIDSEDSYESSWKTKALGGTPSNYDVEIEYYYYFNQTFKGDGSSYFAKRNGSILYKVKTS